MNQIEKINKVYGYHYIDHSQGGCRHRDDDLPAKVWGVIILWYKNGSHHRTYGPAAICGPNQDTAKWRMIYYQNDKIHRNDGPAFVSVEYHPIFDAYIADTVTENTPKPIFIEKALTYYRRDKNITEDVEKWQRDNNISENHNEWTDTDKMLYKLTFG